MYYSMLHGYDGVTVLIGHWEKDWKKVIVKKRFLCCCKCLIDIIEIPILGGICPGPTTNDENPITVSNSSMIDSRFIQIAYLFPLPVFVSCYSCHRSTICKTIAAK